MGSLRRIPRPRTDALNNRELLLDAAETVFLDKGIDAPLDLVHERANVGRATLFRNFPDRQSLMLALLERSLDRLQVEADELGADPDALVKLLQYLADRALVRAPLIDYWRAIGPSQEMQTALTRFIAIFTKPVRQAVAAGRCRPDLQPGDVLFLGVMLTTRPLRNSASRVKHMARAWMLTLAAAGLTDPDK